MRQDQALRRLALACRAGIAEDAYVIGVTGALTGPPGYQRSAGRGAPPLRGQAQRGWRHQRQEDPAGHPGRSGRAVQGGDQRQAAAEPRTIRC